MLLLLYLLSCNNAGWQPPETPLKGPPGAENQYSRAVSPICGRPAGLAVWGVYPSSYDPSLRTRAVSYDIEAKQPVALSLNELLSDDCI